MRDEPERSSPDDRALALQAQRGCRDSFEELLRRYQVPLLHFLGQFAGWEDAEDIAQETFIQAYRRLKQYKSQWRFSTWLFTIARRTAINNQRRQARIKEGTNGDATEIAVTARSAEPLAALTAADNKRQIWTVAANMLSEEQHTALWLYYVEDMPVKEIAAVLGQRPPATKMILHRARQTLTPTLKKMELHYD